MYTDNEKNRIRQAVKDRPELVPIFTSTMKIPERFREYAKEEVFICWNKEYKVYEVHSLRTRRMNKNRLRNRDTYNLTVHFNQLDDRLLRLVRKNDCNRSQTRERIYGTIRKDKYNRQRDVDKSHGDFIKDLSRDFEKISLR